LIIKDINAYPGLPQGTSWSSWSADVTTSFDPYEFSGYDYAYGPGGATVTPRGWPATGNPFHHSGNTMTPGKGDYPLPGTTEVTIQMPNVSATFKYGWLNGGVRGYNGASRERYFDASEQIVNDGIYCPVNGKTFAEMG